MDNKHELERKEKWIKLSEKEVKKIFNYYIAMFIVSLVLVYAAVNAIVNQTAISLKELLLFSFVFGIFGSTFYYIRKLYKSCIQMIVDTQDRNNLIVTIGVKVYFYFRPVMGAALAMLVILGIYGGFFFLQEQPTFDTKKFYIFSDLLSFLVGFSNGKIINKMDSSKEKIADMIKLGKEH